MNAFDTAVGAGEVGAGSDLVDAQAFVDGAGIFQADHRPLPGRSMTGHPPERYDILVHMNVHAAGSGELGRGHSVHVEAVAETVGKEEDVSVAPRCDGQGLEVVDVDKDTGTVSNGRGRVHQWIVWLKVLGAWHLRQRGSHQRVEMSMTIHQKRLSMLRVRETPKWQEVTLRHVCRTHGRDNIGMHIRGALSERGCGIVTG